MSQQGRRKTKRFLDFQARNQLGTSGGKKSFLREGQFFKTMSNSFKIRQHIFAARTKIFLGEASLPPGYGSIDFCTSQKTNVFCIFHAHFQFLCSSVKFDLANQGLRQPVQPHTFNFQLLVFDKTLAQPPFAVINGSNMGMSVFHSPVLMRRLIFLQLQLCTAVS